MPPKARPSSNPSSEPHKWTNFELRALLCLLVRNVHKTGLDSTELERLGSSTAPRHQHRNLPRSGNSPKNSGRLAYVDVATALNDCCHKFDYENDIPVRDVIDMVDKMLLDNKAAACYSERQPVGRLTRSANRVWKRKINYDGSNAEWEAGRKQKEEIKRREDEERRLNTGAGGGIAAGVDLDGIATGWGDAEDLPDAGWGTGDQTLDKQPSSAEKVAAWGKSMEVDGPLASVEVDDAWGSGDAVPPIGGKAAMINELDVWGSGTGTDVAVPSNVMDTWGAGGGDGLVGSKSTTNVEGERGTSQMATVAAHAKATADWGAHEDPFAAPLPPTRSIVCDAALDASANKKQDPPISSTDNGWDAFESTPAAITTGNDNPWDAAPSVAVPLPTTDWGMDSENTVMAEASITNPSNPSAAVESSINKTAKLSTSDWDSPVIEPANMVSSSNGWGNTNPTKGNNAIRPLPYDSPLPPRPNDSGLSALSAWEISGPTPTTAAPAGSYPLGPFENTTTTAEVVADDSWGTAPAPTAVATGNTESQLKACAADWGDSFVDTSGSASSPAASWGNVIEGIANSNISRLSATASKPFNPADLASAPGINPERLAMLSITGVNNGEEESADTTFSEDQWNLGQKLSRNRDAFASKDNAIPLKYNRLMGQRPDASAVGEQKENEVEPDLTNRKLRTDLDAAQNAEGNDHVDLMDYY